MSDYNLQATWGTKDALAGGQALKAISATELGTEFDAIAAASTTKYDADDLASTAQAQALTASNVLLTPSTLNDVLIDNDGILSNLQALNSAPGVDKILGYDFSATDAIYFGLGTGLTSSGTDIITDDAAIVHDNLSGVDADEHVPHSSVNLTAGAGMTGGGTIAASRTFNVVGGFGITANANDVQLTDQAATTANPAVVDDGVHGVDISALTEIEGNALAAGDIFIVGDNGVPGANAGIKVEEMGLRVQTAQTTQTLAATDLNSIMQFTGTATLTCPGGLPHGVPVVLQMKHATQALTVTVGAGETLTSVFHPGGSASVSDTVEAGGTALLYSTADGDWVLSGDVTN